MASPTLFSHTLTIATTNSVHLSYTFTTTITGTLGLSSSTPATSSAISSASPLSTSSAASSSLATSSLSVASSTPSTASSAVSSTTSSSTTSSAPSSTSASSTAPSNGAATKAPTSSTSNGASNTGLEAGVGVLAALLALALIGIAFLLYKRRRDSHNFRSRNTELDALEGGRATRASEKDTLLRDAQASLITGSGPSMVLLDDRSVNSKFASLSQEINNWVLAHFKNISPATTLSAEARQAVNQQPNYASLLKDPRGKFLIMRAVVADHLYEAFHTGEINGLGETMRMKNHLPENIPFREQSLWRSNTVILMEKDSSFREKQAAAVQALTQRIDSATAALAGLRASDSRLRALTRVVQTAADIALELSKQRVDFYMFAPRDGVFDSAKMEDVLQEFSSENLVGQAVLSVVFPAVLRHGDDSGAEFDQVKVISKAMVLVNHEQRAI